jgi:hypothetical protein
VAVASCSVVRYGEREGPRRGRGAERDAFGQSATLEQGVGCRRPVVWGGCGEARGETAAAAVQVGGGMSAAGCGEMGVEGVVPGRTLGAWRRIVASMAAVSSG